ncbi:MAG: hypothetical protein CBB92_10865 [Flammeovirgaceae bacterium TMED32]|nr:MAG: hypothetical protein CBB92_10865 [Flammeovirgaceae bacterium TMED32]
MLKEIGLLLLSLLPGLIIIIFIFFSDKHEKEPIGLLAISFFFGILTFGLSYYTGDSLAEHYQMEPNNLWDELFFAFIIVAFVEEIFKFSFVRFILYRNHNFNEPFDGIVYTVMVAMGFATIENVIFVMQGGVTTGIVIMFSTVPAHATFAVIMGYYLGKAKFNEKKVALDIDGDGIPDIRFNTKVFTSLIAIIGFVIATIIHGFYDYFLLTSFMPGIWIMAFISLSIAVLFAQKAMTLHQDASPFKKSKS